MTCCAVHAEGGKALRDVERSAHSLGLYPPMLLSCPSFDCPRQLNHTDYGAVAKVMLTKRLSTELTPAPSSTAQEGDEGKSAGLTSFSNMLFFHNRFVIRVIL